MRKCPWQRFVMAQNSVSKLIETCLGFEEKGDRPRHLATHVMVILMKGYVVENVL